MPEAFLLAYAFIFGLIVGSFLNVVILRLPSAEESIVFPASRCPQCREKILWYDNIPVLSFILLKRRCRHCGAAISWQYPLVEAAMGLISLALLNKFGLSAACAIYFVFSASLLVVMVIDFYHQIIPDAISLPGVFAGFAVSGINPAVTWQESGLGLLLGGGILYAIATAYYLLTKREGMGGGDIKLLAMIGAFLGWQSLFFVIFGSSLVGALVGIGAMFKQKKGGLTQIPFGPFLAAAALFYMFYQEKINLLLRMYFLPPV